MMIELHKKVEIVPSLLVERYIGVVIDEMFYVGSIQVKGFIKLDKMREQWLIIRLKSLDGLLNIWQTLKELVEERKPHQTDIFVFINLSIEHNLLLNIGKHNLQKLHYPHTYDVIRPTLFHQTYQLGKNPQFGKQHNFLAILSHIRKENNQILEEERSNDIDITVNEVGHYY